MKFKKVNANTARGTIFYLKSVNAIIYDTVIKSAKTAIPFTTSQAAKPF